MADYHAMTMTTTTPTSPTTSTSDVPTKPLHLSPTTTPPPSTSSKKPRGRPPGSKNKPKPPTIIMHNDSSSLHVTILHVPSGADILLTISAFARRRRAGLSVLSASGAVAALAVRHPPNSTFTLHGRFDLVSLSGTLLPDADPDGFSVTVAGPQGALFGGTVAGALTAAGVVVVVVGVFGTSEVCRLGEEIEEETKVGLSNVGSSGNAVVVSSDVNVPWSSGHASSGAPQHGRRF